MLKLFTGAHENFALEAVLNDHVESVKCITDSNRVYYSSAIAGFTIEVTLKPGASAHLGSLVKISKEDEDAIAQSTKKGKHCSNPSCPLKSRYLAATCKKLWRKCMNNCSRCEGRTHVCSHEDCFKIVEDHKE